MFYESLLSPHNLTIEQLSKPTQALIAKYKQTTTYLSDVEAKLAAASGDRTKNKLTKEVDDVKTYLLDLEKQITRKIEIYAKNKDVYAANADRLKKAREGKVIQKAAPSPVVDAPAPVSEPIVHNEGGVIADADKATSDSSSAPIKKKSGIGWLVGGLVAVVLAGVGINYYNNR